VYLPPEGYLERLAVVARRHGILLIYDEVITGFGRTGLGAFASGRLGPVPDLLTMAKGLTNGAVPMGAVAASREVYDVFMEKSAEGVELFHGYTYSGHPAACAAALAALGIYEREGLFERAGRIAPKFQEMLYSFAGRPGIADVRGLGLIGGIELQPQGAPGAAGMKAFTALWEAGLLGRVTGDTLAFSPPLIIEETHIRQIGRLLEEVLGLQYGW
jgi:beta-alanine--pyruvate transaminase